MVPVRLIARQTVESITVLALVCLMLYCVHFFAGDVSANCRAKTRHRLLLELLHVYLRRIARQEGVQSTRKERWPLARVYIIFSQSRGQKDKCHLNSRFFLCS